MTLRKKREQPLSLVILIFQDKIPHAWHKMKVKFEEEILDASRFLRSSPELVWARGGEDVMKPQASYVTEELRKTIPCLLGTGLRYTCLDLEVCGHMHFFTSRCRFPVGS